MFGPYVAQHFGKQFFTNLKSIARMGVLLEECQTSTGRAEIYLPFCPHFFINVISSNLDEEFDIDYIEESDISIDNHRLHTATESEDHIAMANYFQIMMEH